MIERTGILVIGMHRSGTSAITRTLSLMGGTLPSRLLEPSASENPAGFWESADIVASHDRFLATVGSRWDDPLPLPDSAFKTLAANHCHDELINLLHRDFDDAACFVIKDPRLCRLLPLWRSVLESFGARPAAVLPVRDPLAVALSLHRRNGFPREKSLALWLVHALLAEQSTRDWPRRFVLYDDFIADSADAARRLASRIGCFPAAEIEAALPSIQEFWSADLRHHTPAADPSIPSWVQSTHSWLIRAAETGEPETGELDAIWAALTLGLEVYGPLIGQAEQAMEAVVRAKDEELAGSRQRTCHLEGDITAARASLERMSAEELRLHEDGDALRRQAERDQVALAAEQALSARLTAEAAHMQTQAAELRRALDRASADQSRLLENNDALHRQAERDRAALAAEQVMSARLTAEAAHLQTQAAELRGALDRASADQLCVRKQQEALAAARLAELERQGAEHTQLLRHLATRCSRRRWLNWLRLLPHLRGRWFDKEHYLSCCPDAADSWLPLRLHYLWVGRSRGASPTPLFDPTYYRSRNPDVAASGGDPLAHYLHHGGAEGRKPSPAFDSRYYLQQNPDVARQGANPLRHYLNHGWRERRDHRTSPQHSR